MSHETCEDCDRPLRLCLCTHKGPGHLAAVATAALAHSDVTESAYTRADVAAAWEQGFQAGMLYERETERDIMIEAPSNPYRETPEGNALNAPKIT